VVGELNPRRGREISPLVRVIFSVRDERGRGLRLPGAEVEVADVFTATAKFDLDIAVILGEDRVTGTIEYNAAVLDEADVAGIAETYAAVLGRAVADPSTRLAEFAGRQLGKVDR
jgi:hypothetical protein